MRSKPSVKFLELLRDLFVESKIVPIDFRVGGYTIDLELTLTKSRLSIRSPLGHGYWANVMVQDPLLRDRLMDFLIEEYHLMLASLLDTKLVRVHVTATVFAGVRLNVIIEDSLPEELTDGIVNHKALACWTPPEV